MNNSELLVLAKQGEPQAIAALINHQLQPKGIISKVNIVQNQLQIILEAKEAPPEQILVDYIYKAIHKLGAPSIEKLTIYGKQLSDDFPAWQQEFKLLISQSCSNSNSKAEQQKIMVNSSIEIKRKNTLENAAKMGDVEALRSLIEQELGNFVAIKPSIKFGILSLDIKSIELEPSEGIVKILKLLNRIIPKKFKTIQILGKFNNQTWIRQLAFKSGRYVDDSMMLWATGFASLFCLGILGFSWWVLFSTGMTPSFLINTFLSKNSTLSSSATSYNNTDISVAIPGDEACHRKFVSVKLDTFKNCLVEGMSHSQVSEVLGYSGTLGSQSSFIELWQWQAGTGQYLTIMFAHDKLQSKSQVGLE